MRPRISYLTLALSAATGGANVTLINNGTLDAMIAANLGPGGTTTWMATRHQGQGVAMLATNIDLPWE
jgi:hypothetical protein